MYLCIYVRTYYCLLHINTYIYLLHACMCINCSFPDVMMESYSVKPLTPIFFVIFLIIGLYIIINVLLATVYSTFKENQKRKFLEISKRKRYVLH